MMPKTKPLSDMIRAKRKIPTTRTRPSSTGPPAHETCALGAEFDGLGVKMQPNHFEQRRTGAGVAVNLCSLSRLDLVQVLRPIALPASLPKARRPALDPLFLCPQLSGEVRDAFGNGPRDGRRIVSARQPGATVRPLRFA